MDQTTNTYNYSPLSVQEREFCIITLSPGTHGASIDCSLVHVFARDHPEYEAVSYVWGDPHITLPIVLQGQEFRVTTNLESALQHLRLTDKPRALWVDALCINQADNVERGLQVQGMRDIYKAATRVLAWLGEENEDSPLFFRYITERFEVAKRNEYTRLYVKVQELVIARSFLNIHLSKVENQVLRERSEPSKVEMASIDLDLRNWKSKVSELVALLDEQGLAAQPSTIWDSIMNGKPEMSESDIEVLNDEDFKTANDALADLTRQPWWERIWVVQEVGVAREVVFICGSLSSSWNEFRSVIDFISNDELAIAGSSYHSISNMASVFVDPQTGKQHNLSLLELLNRFRYCEATDPRDKIYALLGLAADIEPTSFPVNYDSPTRDVYKNLVMFLISRHKNLDVLGHCFERDTSSIMVSKMPSWTPDWTTPSYCKPFHKRMVTASEIRPLYSTAGAFVAFSITIADPDVLHLRGFHFDTIYYLSDVGRDISGEGFPEEDFASPTQKVTNTQDWEVSALEVPHLGCPYAPRYDRLHAFWRTLIADTIGTVRTTEETFKLFQVWSGRATVPENEADTENRYANAVHAATTGRRFFISNRGYMGLAPSTARSGDLICVLFGGQMPFVVREQGVYSELMGEAYVHGIMDGEAMEAFKNGEYGQWDYLFR